LQQKRGAKLEHPSSGRCAATFSPWGEGKVMPLGRFRDRAAQAADLFVVEQTAGSQKSGEAAVAQ
jgi:hypothetical protein